MKPGAIAFTVIWCRANSRALGCARGIGPGLAVVTRFEVMKRQDACGLVRLVHLFFEMHGHRAMFLAIVSAFVLAATFIRELVLLCLLGLGLLLIGDNLGELRRRAR